LQYPVDELRVKAGSRKSDEHEVASNARSQPARRHIVRRYAHLKPQQIFLAVHRVEFTVYYRRLEPREFLLLEGIGQGRTIGEALDTAGELDPETIQTWFANWAQLGWLA
jgi:hypothetical protein